MVVDDGGGQYVLLFTGTHPAEAPMSVRCDNSRRNFPSLKNVSLPPAFPAEAPATALPDADSSPPSLGLGGTPLTLPLGMAVPGLPFTSAPGPVAGGDTSGRGEGAWLLIRGMGLSHLICVCKGGVGALLGGEGAGEWGEGGLLSPTTPSPPPSSPALLILTHTSVLDNSVLFFMVSSAST